MSHNRGEAKETSFFFCVRRAAQSRPKIYLGSWDASGRNEKNRSSDFEIV
jgi:hypothetical protein